MRQRICQEMIDKSDRDKSFSDTITDKHLLEAILHINAFKGCVNKYVEERLKSEGYIKLLDIQLNHDKHEIPTEQKQKKSEQSLGHTTKVETK
jgi:hypothetical protein